MKKLPVTKKKLSKKKPVPAILKDYLVAPADVDDLYGLDNSDLEPTYLKEVTLDEALISYKAMAITIMEANLEIQGSDISNYVELYEVKRKVVVHTRNALIVTPATVEAYV